MDAKFGPFKMVKNLLTLIEITFFKIAAEYTLLEHKINEEILEELRVEPADEILKRSK
jgi:hypothetical protein